MENYFFELTIYRCSPDEHLLNLQKIQDKISERLKPIEKHSSKEFIDEAKSNNYNRLSYSYEYNEIIGWIKLYVLGNQLRGDYHFEVNAQNRTKEKIRFTKGIRKKQFDEFGKAFEMSIDSNLESREIYKCLIDKLNYINKHEEPFKRRYFDLSKLEKISKFVDWKNLILELNPFNN